MNNSFCSYLSTEDFKHYNYVVMLLYVPVALIALISNTLLIVIVIKFQWMRNVTNYFLVNLAVADLLVTIVCMPNGIIASYTMLWQFDDISCTLKTYFQCVAVAASVFTITSMAVDRYLAITQPFGFCRWFTKKSTIGTIVLIWITSVSFFAPILIITRVETMPLEMVCNDTEVLRQFRICTEDWTILSNYLTKPTFGVASFIVMFCIPGFIILMAYSLMGKKLCSIRPPFDENKITSQQSNRLIRERKRVAWILLSLAVLFAVCWMPYNTLSVLKDYGYSDITLYEQYTLLLGHANSALNPVVYCVMSKNFRNSVAQIFCGLPAREGKNNLKLKVKWEGPVRSSQEPPIGLQRLNTRDPAPRQQMTLSRYHSSQKTTKTCAV